MAESAGVVPASCNRYFGSKSACLARVDDFFDRFHAEFLDLDLGPGGDWAQHERLRLEAGVRFHYREPLAVVV